MLLRPPRAVADEERYFLAQSALFEAGGGFERYADAAAALVAARGSGEAGGSDLNNDHLLLGLGFGDTLADSASIVMPGQPGQSPQGGANAANASHGGAAAGRRRAGGSVHLHNSAASVAAVGLRKLATPAPVLGGPKLGQQQQQQQLQQCMCVQV